MLFHYVSGSLMCEIRIKGLTLNINGWTVYNYWKDRPTDPEILDCDYSDYDYGGFDHFVCESLSRGAAQRIVTALGGYLVDDSYVPAGRQLDAGGPFFIHRFKLYNPTAIGRVESIQSAKRFLRVCVPGRYRIYDASGYMVMEITKNNGGTENAS